MRLAKSTTNHLRAPTEPTRDNCKRKKKKKKYIYIYIYVSSTKMTNTVPQAH